jgi:hypothetical protein
MSSCRRLFAAMISVVAAAVLSAVPAHADQTTYLDLVAPRFTSVSPEQLVAEAHRICSATQNGMTASDANVMVQRDLGVSVPVSIDIVAAAVVQMC